MTLASLADVTCSIARTFDVTGDAWAWLIVRDAHRFDGLCADLGVSRTVLATAAAGPAGGRLLADAEGTAVLPARLLAAS